MKRLISIAFLFVLVVPTILAGPFDSTFTYQGRLQDGGQPANGNYDFQFALYPGPTNDIPVGTPVTNSAVPVVDGLFTVTLNFGDVFGGANYWLGIGVRTNGGTNSFVALTPRQPISPVPYSLYSQNAGTASNAFSVAATNLTGIVPLTSLPGDIAIMSGSANFPQLAAGNLYGGEIHVTNELLFPLAGDASPITLAATNYSSPYAFGGVSPTLNFSVDKTNRVFISERVIADEYVNNPVPIVSGVLGIYGAAGDQLAFTHFQYGAEIAFRNTARELEFHGFNGGFYTPLLSLLAGSQQYGYVNEVQIRNPFDTNSIILRYPAFAAPSITTEFPGTDLGIEPTGQLLLGSLGVAQWAVTNGNLIPLLDNSYDIGATNGSRPRNITASGNTIIAGGLSVGNSNPPSSTFQLAGSFAGGIAHITNNYTLGAGDLTVIVDVGGVIVNLPSAVGITGRIYAIKNGPGASSVIRAQTPQTIDGEPVIALNSPYQAVNVQSDGVQWWIISSSQP